ncbi:MAG: transglycosylase domain-containing protein [Ktedonobacteraceae bacterium]|nr:transglycosylase domain-containing protein [Ktedonobacteraceae bacterium]
MRKDQQIANEDAQNRENGHDQEVTQALRDTTEKREPQAADPQLPAAVDDTADLKPARLPAHSRAAAAQRLGDLPEQPVRGVYYPVPHRLHQPAGWRTKRHLKRKNLRLSNLRYASTERGSHWAMLPMASGILLTLLLLSSALITFTAFNGATQQRYGEGVTTLQDIIPKDNLKMYDSQGKEIYQMLDSGLQISVPLAKISPNLVHAEIAIEDQNFWSNPGYDITGIVRAALDDLTRGHVVSGASTITQQLIKNNIVGNQTSVMRKLEEILLAPSASRQYTKEQILEMYLNTTYYGEQAYGAEAAAFTYFGLKGTPEKTAASQLDIAQAATLAGIPSSPVARDPFLFPQPAQARTRDVLKELYLQNYINHDQYMQALSEIKQPNFLKHGRLRFDPRWSHFVQYTINELTQNLHVKRADLSRSGLMISTTLDTDLQAKSLKIAQDQIAKMAHTHNMTNAAVVAIDYRTGAIRTLVGNVDPSNPKTGAFDVATQGFRQPGSAFKPFIYATAFSKGISPGQPVLDGPLTVQMCCGLPSYSPHNYDNGYHGLITYRYALQNSFNIPAVKLLMDVGVDDSLKMAENLGMGPYNGTPNYTMVLGSLGVHLLDMTSAYSTFANGGIRIPPHAVDSVTDIYGHVIYHAPVVGKRVLSKQVAYMMTDVLSDNSSRSFEFGKCSMLYLFSTTQAQCYAGNPGPIRPAALKTGTSNDFRDNWTVGYTTDLAVGVWTGNNDNTPMVNVIGVDGAGPIAHDVFIYAERGRPIQGFNNPGGLVKKTVRYPGITSTDWYLK